MKSEVFLMYQLKICICLWLWSLLSYFLNAGLKLLTSYGTSDIQEALALSYRKDSIDIYSNSWGPVDSGHLVEGPRLLTKLALEEGAKSVSTDEPCVYGRMLKLLAAATSSLNAPAVYTFAYIYHCVLIFCSRIDFFLHVYINILYS